MNCQAYNKFFGNFANKANIEIITLLQHGPANVSAISEQTGQEQSAVSHNLKKLLACNILTMSKNGRERVYALNAETIQPILDLVAKHVESNCEKCAYE